MIFESEYWKEDLIRIAASLSRRASQKRWTRRSIAAVEKEVFIGFYIVRKLLEAQKLSEEARKETYPVLVFNNKGIAVNRRNFHKMLELYNLDTSYQEQRGIEFLANVLIHSYVFCTDHSSDLGLEAILFNSDRGKNKVLYRLEVRNLVTLFEDVAKDDILYTVARVPEGLEELKFEYHRISALPEVLKSKLENRSRPSPRP